MSLIVVSLPSDPGLVEAVGEIPEVEFVSWDLDGPPPAERIDIVVPPYLGGHRRLRRVAEVDTRLVQWQSIGYDGVSSSLPSGVPFANAATVHETGTAELAIALALASQRGIPGFVRDGDAHVWDERPRPSLADRRVLLIGYGGVGKATDARLAGFEVNVTRIASTARQDENLAGETVEVRGAEDLLPCLSEAEIVILTVPLTEETRGMIDARALAAMRSGSLLVNVARGPVVDTDALVAEVGTGRLRAALDVTDPEPLPADHPLWDCPGVLITPHVGGDSSAMLPRVSALIRRQIERMQRGEEAENLISL